MSPLEPIGVFRAITTRDGAALDRDGEPFHAYKALPETDPTESPLYEIQFADGIWMLATLTDLDLG